MGAPAERINFQVEQKGGFSADFEMSNKTYKDAAPDAQAVFQKAIKVIAIGGGGGNALNHIISHGIEGVDMLAVNTDARSLDMSLCDAKIILGENVTKGLGAGALPEVGARAAAESIGEIRAYLKGADMVYLAAGMGGGTGTGAIPIIARAAKEMGILTVAVVTKPFSFEGRRRSRYAEEGIEKLMPEVDALIVVPNDRLLDIASKDTSIMESFSLADEILRQAVQGVTDLVTRPGFVNVDFADLKNIMKGAGRSVMGIGEASGEDCIVKAVEKALESPLMECSMRGAKGVLLNITFKNELPLYDIQRAADIVESVVSEDSNFVWGCGCDPQIENDVEVTVVAAGFEAMEGARREPARRTAQGTRPDLGAQRIETRHTFAEAASRAMGSPAAKDEDKPAEEPEEIHPDAGFCAPAWLLEEDEESELQPPAANAKPTQFTARSAYDAYENPTFIRRGNSVQNP